MTWIAPHRRAKPKRRRAFWLLVPLALIVLAGATWLVWRAPFPIRKASLPRRPLPSSPLRPSRPPWPKRSPKMWMRPPPSLTNRHPYSVPPPAPPCSPRPIAAPASLPFIAASLPRALLLPYTIIPERPREKIIEYVVQEGDTLESIAAQYGLLTETLAWSNNHRYVQVIYPGERVVVPAGRWCLSLRAWRADHRRNRHAL